MAFHMDIDFAQFYYFFGQRKPDTITRILFAFVAVIHLEKIDKQLLYILRRNALAVVGDPYLHRLSLCFKMDLDMSPIRSELEGVGQQVKDHLLHLCFVKADFDLLCRARKSEKHASRLRQFPEGVCDRPYKHDEILRGQVQVQMLRLRPAEFHQLFHQPQQTVGIRRYELQLLVECRFLLFPLQHFLYSRRDQRKMGPDLMRYIGKEVQLDLVQLIILRSRARRKKKRVIKNTIITRISTYRI